MKPVEIEGHWEWVDGLIDAIASDNGGHINLGFGTIEYLYKTALEHGAKHEREDRLARSIAGGM